MRLIFGFFITVLLFILISCTKENTPTSLVIEHVEKNYVTSITVEEASADDPCNNITCPKDKNCSNGLCVCNKGTKECNKECINLDACCSDNDCKEKESCVNEACVKPQRCDFLQQWSPNLGECICITGTKFCANQKKCIPIENCCNFDNCNPLGGNDKSCTETQFLAYLCVAGDGSSACRYFSLDKRERISLTNTSFDLFLTKIYDDNEAEFNIIENKNNVSIKNFKIGEEIIVPFATIKYSNVSLRGGKCKLDIDKS